MGDLSENLSRREFICECGCGFDTVDAELLSVLQGTCDYFALAYDVPARIIITGGNRCHAHNTNQRTLWELSGGNEGSKTAKHSLHVFGRAADFKIEVLIDGSWQPVHPDAVADYLEATFPGKYGIGRYHGRTHVDTRTNDPARWDGRR